MSEIEELISQGEGEQLEFKKTINHPDKIARTLVALANTRGGILLVGVLDNGKICGVDPEEEKHSLLEAARNYCNPPVKIFFKEVDHEENITLLKTIVPESRLKPHLAKIKENDWRAFVRVQAETVQASPVVLQALTAEADRPYLYQPDTQPETLVLRQLQLQPQINLPQFMQLAQLSREQAAIILLRLTSQGLIRLHNPGPHPYYTLP